MKIIFKIARTELRNLFYSPVAWFLTVAFLVQCGIFYGGPLENWSSIQDLYARNNPKFVDFGEVSMTRYFFLIGDSFFVNVLQNLFLFVPLLCMGLISREVNNGTIKLLYSSPVKVRSIVLGKYLAIMLYNVLLLLIVGIFMVTGIFNIRHADIGLLLSAALGFYLLVCAYTAIGLFMSSLTTYQIVSAISSFIIVFVLSRIGGLWQKIDFVRDLTYFLSISGRTTKMLRGLITTKDVIYFVLIVYLFLSFAYLKLKGGRESKPWYVRARGYVLVSVVVLSLGYISSRPVLTGYWDVTDGKVNTIHPNTQKIIQGMKKDQLEVVLYTNLLGGGFTNGLPEARNAYLSGMWEPYVRFKPDIVFKYEYYYGYDPIVDDSLLARQLPGKKPEKMAREMARSMDLNFSMFKPESEIRKTVDLRPENFRLVMELRYNGQRAFLRTFNDQEFWPDEAQVGAALKRLQQTNMPKLLFVSGDLERDINKRGEREYKRHALAKDSRASLLNLGFDSDTINLRSQDIPAGITALVLADPKCDLPATSVAKMKQYIDQGGNMLILGEPGKQYVLNPMLQSLGGHLQDGILVEPSKEEMPHMVRPYLTAAFMKLADEPALIPLRKPGSSAGVLMPGVTALSYSEHGPFTIHPLLVTEEKDTWLKTGVLVTDSAAPVFSPQEGDTRGAFATMLALTRSVNQREQRIVISGDADFLSNCRGGGGAISRAIYSWLDYNQFPIYAPRENPKDNLLTVSVATAGVLRIVYIWVLPAIVLLMGVILLIRRKRK